MNNKVQMVDLRSQYLRIKEEIDSEIHSVLDSTAFINGPKVQEFTRALEKFLNINKVIPCGNGTDALQIALMALELDNNAEVIVPAHTYVATVEVIALLGLKPVFVDVESKYFNIDTTKIEEVTTENTRVIMPVHLYGQCAEMDKILDLAERNDLKVIEDTAQALGSYFISSDGRRKLAGTLGDIGTTSFFPSKNLGCFGDGGAIMTNDVELGIAIGKIANHGQTAKYYHDLVGVNSRLDDMQAAILSVKLKHLEEFLSARVKVANTYDEALKNCKSIKIPNRASYSTHTFHQYTITVLDGSRDQLKEHLLKKGIPSVVYYPLPVHLQKAYKHYGYGEGDFPIAESLSRNILSLPIHTEMESDQQDYIIDHILNFFA